MCQVFIGADPALYESRLHDELMAERADIENFASFLRVCCGRYLALQLSGGIPRDASIPIASLNAQRVLAAEQRSFVRFDAAGCAQAQAA
jgi:predicted DNA-binding ribbon-helix-helix protein